jgi:hypothetical protein
MAAALPADRSKRLGREAGICGVGIVARHDERGDERLWRLDTHTASGYERDSSGHLHPDGNGGSVK